MHTPQWYGSIGVMNGAHMYGHGAIRVLRRAIAELRYAIATFALPHAAPLRARQKVRDRLAGLRGRAPMVPGNIRSI
jgi:hypothetical protein